MLDQYGLEIAIPSTNDRERTSYDMISRGKSRFVDKSPYFQRRIQIWRRITLWTSKSRMRIILLGTVEYWHPANWCGPCFKSNLQQGGLCGHHQHSSYPCVLFHAKKHSHDREDVESYSCQSFVWRSPVNGSLQDGYEIGASLRPRWTTVWGSTSLGHDKASIVESIHQSWNTIFLRKHSLLLIHEGSSRKKKEYCEDSKKSLAYFRARQGHSGGISIDPELVEYIRIPYNWKEYVFHRSCSFSIQSILEHGLIPGGHEKR